MHTRCPAQIGALIYGLAMVAYGIKTPPQHGPWADFLDVWRAADDIEIFESAWTMDHFYPLTPPLDGTHLESWAVLAALAQATKRLRLGCMVNGMHYRHPAVTANAAVTLDHISGGRFNLGLGAGWFEPESNAYGIPLGSLKERFDRFDEGLEVITSLLTNEYTNFNGQLLPTDQCPLRAKAGASAHPHRGRRTWPEPNTAGRGTLGRHVGHRRARQPGGVEGDQRHPRSALRRHRS